MSEFNHGVRYNMNIAHYHILYNWFSYILSLNQYRFDKSPNLTYLSRLCVESNISLVNRQI